MILKKLRPYQRDAFHAVMNWVKKSVDPCLLEAATGCHEKGHPILMADGRIKPVEKIAVGDELMGPDSSKRVVKKLHAGFQNMFRITPTKGESFVVNSGHILSLYVTPRRKGDTPSYCEISVEDYIKQNNHFKHRAKLQRVNVEFNHNQHNEFVIDPYTVGALIGDGCMVAGTPSFCSPDPEVVSSIDAWVKKMGCKLSIHGKNSTAPTYAIVDPLANRSVKNRCRTALENADIYWSYADSKKIPDDYKLSNRFNRLEIIAGLIDTDGHLSRSGYDWISKSELLADDMVFLCRSVGLAAYKKACIKSCQNNYSHQYYRVSISGDCSIVPCRVPRRKAFARKQIKRVDVTGFSVQEVGVGSYYGFEVDSDHLYLDGFFVRHHNSGKSWIIAALADELNKISKGKHVLCLAPNSDLVKQNREKYLSTGNPASVFSASAGATCLKHPIVFGTPGTVKNKISRFGGHFCAVVVDECHGVTPTIRAIIDSMREKNPKLRVIGTTASPYRLGTGYIYAMDENGKPMGENETRDPYFTARVFSIKARELIEQGFLTPPVVGSINSENYETAFMQLNKRGQFNSKDIDKAFHGHGRKTSHIIADVVAQSQNRKGVMIFAATVQHAEECLASLPPGMSRMIGGKINTSSKARTVLVNDFKAKKFKYLVSVATMTTGVDFTHVDVIAILRATESVGLLQQIIGRALRLDEGKKDALILDYAENIDRHCPDGDIFAPNITVSYKSSESVSMTAMCPQCDTENEFSARQNDEGFKIDKYGYFVDLEGQRVETEHGDMPAHYGRRCAALHRNNADGKYYQCSYRWTFKNCPHCDYENDIAARYCKSCKGEIIDPNEKLQIEFKALKRDPSRIQTDKVISWEKRTTISAAGNECLRVDYVTEYRKFSIWYQPNKTHGQRYAEYQQFNEATNGGKDMPETITYKKSTATSFYTPYGYNRPYDEVGV